MAEILPHERAVELIARSQAGDTSATNELCEKNIALVKCIAKKFLGRGAEFDDLVQIGSVGLLKAVNHFDSSFGVRFSTYAVPMISGEIKRFLRDDGMIKVSRSLKERAACIFRASEELSAELDREPTVEEVSERTGMSSEEIVAAVESARQPVSIYSPAFDNDSDLTLLDRIGDETPALTERIALKELLMTLSAQERRIIFMRFFKDMTQDAIAKQLNISQVQVSRNISKIISKLREETE